LIFLLVGQPINQPWSKFGGYSPNFWVIYAAPPPQISTFPGHARDAQGVVALGCHGPRAVRAVHLIVHRISVIVGEIDPVDVLGASFEAEWIVLDGL
jgi:hypothetical protein